MQAVNLAVVAVEPDGPVFGQQFPQQEQAFVHELEVAIARPAVPVLDFSPHLGGGRVPQANLAHVIGVGIEGRIDVDQLHPAAHARGQQVGQRRLIVAEIEPIALIQGRRQPLPRGGELFHAVHRGRDNLLKRALPFPHQQ